MVLGLDYGTSSSLVRASTLVPLLQRSLNPALIKLEQQIPNYCIATLSN